MIINIMFLKRISYLQGLKTSALSTAQVQKPISTKTGDNISLHPLSEDEKSLFSKDLNFAVAPKKSSVELNCLLEYF